MARIRQQRTSRARTAQRRSVPPYVPPVPWLLQQTGLNIVELIYGPLTTGISLDGIPALRATTYNVLPISAVLTPVGVRLTYTDPIPWGDVLILPPLDPAWRTNTGQYLQGANVTVDTLHVPVAWFAGNRVGNTAELTPVGAIGGIVAAPEALVVSLPSGATASLVGAWGGVINLGFSGSVEADTDVYIQGGRQWTADGSRSWLSEDQRAWS